MPEVQRISSRDNPLLVKVRKLGHDPVAYRKLGLVWIEGDRFDTSISPPWLMVRASG